MRFIGITFLISVWFVISNIIPPAIAQWSDTTSVILLKFSEPMSMDSLLFAGNYKVQLDNSQEVFSIYKIGLLKEEQDSAGNIVNSDTSKIVLVTERLPYKKTFIISASNVKDRAGNLIDSEHKAVWYFHNGYTPDKLTEPEVEINR